MSKILAQYARKSLAKVFCEEISIIRPAIAEIMAGLCQIF
jgi:hypothetical protein